MDVNIIDNIHHQF
jgi:ribonuclease HI